MELNYENLVNEFSQEVDIYEMDLVGNLKGLYFGKYKTIIIDSKLSEIEKIGILLEEWGHHKTTTTNILDQRKVENSKQEQQAVDYGIENFISKESLQKAYENASFEKNDYEIAEFLNISEEFLKEVYDYYLRKI